MLIPAILFPPPQPLLLQERHQIVTSTLLDLQLGDRDKSIVS
jgi:hypothetical protein